MFSEMYLPPEVVHIVLTEFYRESDKLGDFLSLRLVCKAWKRTVEHVLKRVPEPPRGYHNVATKAYESEDYFRDYCIPPHPMTLSNKFQTCKGLPLARYDHLVSTNKHSHSVSQMSQKWWCSLVQWSYFGILDSVRLTTENSYFIDWPSGQP